MLIKSTRRKFLVSAIISIIIFLFFYFIDNVPLRGNNLFFFFLATYFLNLISSLIGLFQIIYFFLSGKLNLDTAIFITVFSLVTFIAVAITVGFKGSVQLYQIITQSLMTFVFLLTLVIVVYKKEIKNAPVQRPVSDQRLP
jgi:hypothetical protein